MNQNNTGIIDYNSSSCYVAYPYYTTIYQFNYDESFRIIYNNVFINKDEENPNALTLQAMFEAMNHDVLLKKHNSVNDFFDDLEN